MEHEILIPIVSLYARVEIKIPTRDAYENGLEPLVCDIPINIELKHTGSYRLKQILERIIQFDYPIETGDPEYVVAYRWCLKSVAEIGGILIDGFDGSQPKFPFKGYYAYTFMIPVNRLNMQLTYGGHDLSETALDENISLYHEYGRLIDTE